jgi:hypothetical protein
MNTAQTETPEIADSAAPDELDDLSELEFAPLPPEDASELEDRLYLPGTRHGVRPF